MLTRPLKKTAIGNPAAENRVESRIYPSDGYKYTTPRKKSLLFSATFRRFCYTRSKTPEIDGKVQEIGRKRERLLIVKKEEKRNEKERFSKKEKRKGEREIVKKKENRTETRIRKRKIDGKINGKIGTKKRRPRASLFKNL